jgi:soluble lytic murein transglycosylase-like protein
MKRFAVQSLVLVTGALTLIGMGAVSSMISGRESLVAVAGDSIVVPTDSLTALETVTGQLQATRAELERAHHILEFSGRYAITADLATAIYDHAVAEGISPAVGFALVKIESKFQNTAYSTASAVGLTQLRLPTARAYDPAVTQADLMNRDVNLRIGFRYLRDLLDQFDNDVALALEAYNKGPTLVMAQRELGEEVRGKYSRAVLNGARKGAL